MSNYDFSTLNSTDLEQLSCDLLNAEQPSSSEVRYKTFKEGKDKGIDFLYSTKDNLYEHVGQVKHFYQTGYAGLISVLKKTEVAKVRKLKPNKYIFVTSIDLSVSNTEEILELFSPYIDNLGDIYGKLNLNSLIARHPKILDNHYKLWLSDITVIRKILTSDLEFRSSDFVEKELKKRIRIYVKTPLLDETRKALKKNKFLIITGEPGVGKTTMAEMLIYEYLKMGYTLTYIIDDIREAEKVLKQDNSKQIIYFDDFLGSNSVEINKAKGSETRLRKVLRRISLMENKLVVFTTRSFLLNTAIEESESLKWFNLKAKTSLFELTEYDTNLKKQLFHNHIEVSELEDDKKVILLSDNIQNFVIGHSNFNPRSIEFITSKEVIHELTPSQYESFIRKSFNYPSEIWRHAYLEQIKEVDRILLNTLLPFEKSISLEILEKAFTQRLEFEVEHNNGKHEMYTFQRALKRLDGGFLVIRKNGSVDFINPSLVDFLFSFVQKDKIEVSRIASNVMSISQLSNRLFHLIETDVNELPSSLMNKLLYDYDEFIRYSSSDSDYIRLATIIHKFVQNKNKEDTLEAIIESIDDWESLHSDYSLNAYFNEFLKSAQGSPKLTSILDDKILVIINEMVRGIYDIPEVIDLLSRLADSFNVNYALVDTSNIKSHIDSLFEDYIDQEIDRLQDYVLDTYEVDETIEEIKGLAQEFNDLGIDYKPNLKGFEIDWYEIATDNEWRRKMAKDD